jgi:hypothetical protein
MNDTIGRLSTAITYLAGKIPEAERDIFRKLVEPRPQALEKKRYFSETNGETKPRKAAKVERGLTFSSQAGSTSIALLSEAANRLLAPDLIDESLTAI